jgi:outer membrane lipoprotein SlyB
MINIKPSATAIAIFTALALGACGSMNSPQTTSSNYPPSANSSNGNSTYANSTYGVVQSIDLVRGDSADKSMGFGTLAGAVVGGVVGSQIGDGRGNTAATVAGAAGGAYAGHQIEKNKRSQADVYQITVRMNNGAFQTVTQSTSGDLRVGDRVQIDGGVARRY